MEEHDLLARALARREARKIKEEQEARPVLEDYIRKHGWKDASVVNRFVIQRGNNYYVQTINGVQELRLDKHDNSLSVYPTKLDSWQEETEIQQLAREINKQTRGLQVSAGKIENISIGTISSGSKGVDVKDMKIEKIKDSNLTLTVPGAEMDVTNASGMLDFIISD